MKNRGFVLSSIAFNPNCMPREISRHILSFLKPFDLAQCCQVNSEWNRLASHDDIWLEIAKKIFINGANLHPKTKARIKAWDSHHLKSHEEILDRIQSFLDKISLGQNARFKCIAQAENGLQTISIEIKGDKKSPDFDYYQDQLNFDFTEDYVFVNDFNNGFLLEKTPDTSSFDQPLRTATEITQIIDNFDGGFFFKAKIIFPILKSENQILEQEMFYRIKKIASTRLSFFNKQFSFNPKFRLVFTSLKAGVQASALYALVAAGGSIALNIKGEDSDSMNSVTQLLSVLALSVFITITLPFFVSKAINDFENG